MDYCTRELSVRNLERHELEVRDSELDAVEHVKTTLEMVRIE